MHETTFVNQIFSVVKNRFGKDTLKSVTCVNVKLSPLSHVSKEGLLAAYRQLAKGSCFERIKLNIVPLDLILHCRSCDHKLTVTSPTLNCPTCDSQDIEFAFDKEFFIESIELDQPRQT